jgi:RHS repeat-associated protein
LTAPRVARAATHIPTTTYSTNTTWNLVGSPYILDGNVTVASSATLTIDPGVVVKFNGQSRTLSVNGTLSAVGTSASRITFTSIQDDSIGGDSGGDGATSGAAGQWTKIDISGSSSQLSYVDVRFGGLGSSNTGYGAVHLNGSGDSVAIDHATISDNQRSAILVGLGSSATVTDSSLLRNAVGASVNTGSITLKRSVVADNTVDGLWFNLSGSFAGAGSVVTDSDITRNTDDGLHFQVDAALPVSRWPSGRRNNIHANVDQQLYTLQKKRDADWRGNFWGADAYHVANDAICQGEGDRSLGKLAFRSSQGNPPAGPIDSFLYLAGSDPNNPITCLYDRVAVGPVDYSPFPFRTGPALPLAQSLGLPEFAVNTTVPMSDPVNSATGALAHSVMDLALPGNGVTFAWTRSYNSLDPATGALGQGWTHAYAASLLVRPSGDISLCGGSGQQLEFLRNQDGTFTAAAGGRATLTTIAGGYELVTAEQLRYRFASSGRLTSLKDANEKGLTFAYDGSNRLSTVTDQAGRQATLTYNGSGQLTQVAVPDGRSVSYAYTNGRLTSVTDVRAKVWTYTYESHGWLEKEVDPLNRTVFRNVYGADGRVVEQYDALNNKTSFSWDWSTQTLTATDARNNVWKDVYANNVLVRRTNPLNQTISVAYDADLNQTSVTDFRGNTTTMTYDSRGNLLTRTAPAPLSYVETFSYDAQNNLLTAQDGRGNTTTFEYDANGNVTRMTQPGALVTQYAHDPSSKLLTSATDPRGKVTSYEYDAAANLTAVVTPLGKRTTITRDGAGRALSIVDPRGNESGANPDDYRTSFTYDAAGRKLTQTNPLGHTTTWAYDDAGQPTSITDPLNRLTRYAYDATRRLTGVTAPDNSVTAYAYDAVGNLTRRTDALNHETTYAYDAANRLTGATNPLTKTWSYAYDANGNLTQLTDAANATTDYGYDALNRLTSINYSDATPDVSYGYDPNGNRTSMTDGAGSASYMYDALNRLTELTRGSDSFACTYNGAGNVTERTYPGGRTAGYTYDDDGRLASVSSNGATTTYFYDAAANLTRTALPASNGHEETRTYDRGGRTTEVRNSKAGVTLSFTGYAYDAAGRPTSTTTTAGTTTYTYDQLDRVTAASGGGLTLSYAYDALGNRTSETGPSGTTTYTYNAGDQLTSSSGPGGNVTYGYDANGNQTTAGTRTFTYDLAGRTSSTTNGGQTTSYSYDGDGTRLTTTTGTDVTRYLWDVNHGLPQLALERDGTGATLRNYLQGLGTVSMDAGGQTAYYHRDALGSTLNLTSASGATQWTYTYEPFGAARTTTQNDPAAPANPLRYAGEHLDGSGLYHLRARQYDPTTGRFTATDPLLRSAAESGISSYVYADNLPTALIDPSGLGAVWGGSGIDGWIAAARANACPGPIPPLGCAAAWLNRWLWGCLKSPLCLAGAAFTIIGPWKFIKALRVLRGASKALDDIAPIKTGSAGGPTAGKTFPQSVKDAARAENPTLTCVFCGRPGTGTQVEHAIPRSRGGDATLENAQLACPWCNASKGAGDFPVNPPPDYVGPWPPPWWGLVG